MNDVFQNLFGRDANPKDLKYVKTIENNKNLPIATIIKNGSRDDKAVYNTKKLVAEMVAAEGKSYELDNITQENYKSIYNVKTGLTVKTIAELEAKIVNVEGNINGKTFMLTTGADAITGSAKNDIFVATEDTLTSNDKLNGGQGQDTLDIVDRKGIKFNGFEANSIETIKVTADSTNLVTPNTSVDLTYATDVTKLVNANSSKNLTFDAIDTVPVKGLELTKVTGGNTELDFEATAVVGTADVLNVKLDNVKSTTNEAASSIIANGIETVNVTTTGTESKLLDIDAKQTKVVIAGDKNLTIKNGAATILTATTTIDASAFKGNLTLGTVNSATKDVEVIGGSGNDKVSFNNGFQKGDKFDGGTGTDTIIMTDDSAANKAAGATLANVEELEISNNGQRTIDMDNFASVSKVIYDDGITTASTATVKDAVTGITVEVDMDTRDAGNLVVDLKTDGAADEITVEIDAVDAGSSLASVDAADAETLNISVDDDTINGVGTMTITSLTATDATTLNLSGDADLTIGAVVNPATPVLSVVNASKMTGDLNISGMNTKATGATITLGAGNDVYTVGTSNGADTITLGAGADKIVYSNVAQSNTNMDTITDFKQGQDTLDLTAAALGVTDSSKFVGNKATFAQAQGALKGVGTVSAVFQQDEKILWVDTNIDGTLDSRDFRIKLDGITDLTTIDLGFGAGVSFTAKKVGFNTAIATDSDEGTVTGIKDDTINATVAQLVGSTVDGLVGSDVLNISATAAAGEIADLTGSFTNVETVNIDATVEGLKMDVAELVATQTTAINGVSGKVQTLTVTTGTSLTNTTISNIENLDMSGTVKMTAAQHNAFASIVGSTGTDTAELTTAGTIAANSTVETYSIVEGSTITVGALAQVITETGGAATVSTIILGNGTYTGVYTGIDATDIVKVGTTTNVSANTGLNAGAVISFQNTATAGVGLTLNNTQNGVVTFADTTGAQTVTVNGAADTFTVADGIESYSVIGGSNVTVTATNTAVNVTTTAVAGASTLAVGTNALTGTINLQDTNNADIITAGTVSLAGINAGALTTAEVLTQAANSNTSMTDAQYDGFTIITNVADQTITITDAATTAANVAVETYVFASTAADTITYADVSTQKSAVNISAGGADVLNVDNDTLGAGVNNAVVVTGFSVADDKFKSSIGDVAHNASFQTVSTANAAITGAANSVIEISSSLATVLSPTATADDGAIEAILLSSIGTAAAGNYTAIIYGGGNAYIYQFNHIDTDSDGDIDAAANITTIELIGQINNVAADSLDGINFA